MLSDQILDLAGRIGREMRSLLLTVQSKASTADLQSLAASKADNSTVQDLQTALDSKASTADLADKVDRSEVNEIISAWGDDTLATKTYVDDAVSAVQVTDGSITSQKLADVIDLGVIE